MIKDAEEHISFYPNSDEKLPLEYWSKKKGCLREKMNLLREEENKLRDELRDETKYQNKKNQNKQNRSVVI